MDFATAVVNATREKHIIAGQQLEVAIDVFRGSRFVGLAGTPLVSTWLRAAAVTLGLCLVTAPSLAFVRIPECETEPLSASVHACTEPVDEAWATDIMSRSGAGSLEVAVRDQSLIVVARTDAESLLPCCSLQEPMRVISPGTFGAQYRLQRIDEAHLFFALTSGPKAGRSIRYFGPNARTPAARATISNDIEAFETPSDALGETRRLLLYRSPGFVPAQPYALIVLLDGDSIAHYAALVEPLVERGQLPQLAILGVPSGASGIVGGEDLGFDTRAADYLPGFHSGESSRFERHLEFLIAEAIPFAMVRIGGESAPMERIIAGSSNGAVAALETALSKPDAFTGAIIMSRGYRRHAITANPSARSVRFRLSAGLYEPSFRSTTQRSYAVLRADGFDVTYTDYPDGHSPLQWEFAFVDGLTDLLGGGETLEP